MDIAQRFIDALHTLEAGRDPEPLAGLYAEDAIAGDTATTKTAGAREFWSGYRDTFDEIRSDFRNVVPGDDAVALEWVSTGRLSGGSEVEYEGVTLLELDEGRITRSTAYFDPRAITNVT